MDYLSPPTAANGVANIEYGNCGYSWFYIGDAGYQEAKVYIGAHSTRGAIVYAKWKWRIKNTRTGSSWGREGTNWPWSSTWSRSFGPKFVSWGYWYGSMYYLKVVTAKGYVCYGMTPSDGQWID